MLQSYKKLYILVYNSTKTIKDEMSFVEESSLNQVDSHIPVDQQPYIRDHIVADRRERNKRAITYITICIGLLTVVGLLCGLRVEEEQSSELLTQLIKLATKNNITIANITTT